MEAESHLPEVIKFYNKQDQYGFLSNFYPSPFVADGKQYPTNEHYFQSKKFQGKPMEKVIIEAKAPVEAFRLGRQTGTPLRPDWQEVKEKIMFDGLILKFTQNPNLGKMLLETQESKLVEHTEKDKYWADGGDGSGKNRLGILLMRVRDELKKK